MNHWFLLDTNVISEFNRTGPPDEHVRQWLASVPPDSLHVSVITLAELRFGIELLPEGKRRAQLEQWMEQDFPNWFAGRILPVDDAIVHRWASLSANRQRQGNQLAQFDGLIAATALHHGLTLATRDVNDFRDLGVTLLNPWEARSPTPQWPPAREVEPPAPEIDIERDDDLDR